MKKISLIFLMLGILLILTGGVIVFLKEENKDPLFDIEQIINNNDKYYKVDDSFSYLNFLKRDDEYIVQIRKKSFINNNNFENNYYSLQFPVELKKGELINKKQNFKISFLDGSFIFTSLDEKVGLAFNGTYSLSSLDYSLASIPFRENEGIYKCESTERGNLSIQKVNDDYIINGYILEDTFSNKQIVFEQEEGLIDNYSFKFNENDLLVSHWGNTENESDEYFRNIQCTKLFSISSLELVNELESNILFFDEAYGAFI